MKIRNGFVSNSSSSSFVIIGLVIDKTKENIENLKQLYNEEDIEKYEDDLFYRKTKDGLDVIIGYDENGISERDIVIGSKTVIYDDDGTSDRDIDDILNNIKGMKEKYDFLSDKKIKMITGTMMT